jgi:dolichol-phosphate mannosyltransferase
VTDAVSGLPSNAVWQLRRVGVPSKVAFVLVSLVAPEADSLAHRGLTACPIGPLVIPTVPPEGGSAIRLSLIIPTYNEGKNIGELIRQLTALLDPVVGDGYELVVVDDDSADRTWELAAEIAIGSPKVRVIRRQGEKGLSTAVIRGWQAARGEILAVIDADLQHPPEAAVALFQALQGQIDMAVGSRHVEGGGVSDWSFTRRILSRGAQFLGLLLLPGVLGRVSDPMSGYFMVRRSAIAGVELRPLGYKILLEVIGRGRIRSIAEVGYVFRERTGGESKVTWRLYPQYLLHLVRLRFTTPAAARFIRFALVGLSGVLVDMLALFLLSDPRSLGLGLTRSKVIAAELAIVNNFLWNDVWTFRDLVGAERGARFKLRRFAKFNAICGAGLLLNLALLNLQFNLLHMNRYLANSIGIVVVTVWNYWFNLKLSWRGSTA